MNGDIRKALIIALAGVKETIDEAQKSLNRLDPYFFHYGDDDLGDSEKDLDYERYYGDLQQVFLSLCAMMEAYGFNTLLTDNKAKWEESNGGRNPEDIEPVPDYDCLHSHQLNLLVTYYYAVVALVGGASALKGKTQEDAVEEEAFRGLSRRLESLGHYTKKLGAEPKSEPELHKLARAWLSTEYVDYVDRPKISRPIKGFEPDFGLLDSHVAVELKFVDKEEELKVAFSGILEDANGYKPGQWKRFISLIYQTEAFTTRDIFQSELDRSGINDWRAIVVTGGGGRKVRVKKTPAKTRADAASTPKSK
ncbi:MAG: hypothetical protein KIT79_11760 [Deltaproteobacteria bacterium]|nr:hypothetical protein [Deltaproteobacteria bacterium]